jgi:hypothetical protein
MWQRAGLAALVLMVFGGAASAAECMKEVERVSAQLGVAAPTRNGPPPAERPATTESRGVPPEASSRLSTGTPTAGGDRRGEAVQSLQAARAASAQGNEGECMAQLAKAQEVLQPK